MRSAVCLLAGVGLLWGASARGHFQELIPSPPIVTEPTARTVTLDLTFTHPFDQGPAMEMGRPVRFGVLSGGRSQDLMPLLERVAVDGRTAFRATHRPQGPGGHVYYLEPAPYWEAAEGKWIVHYTKVVVDAFGSGEGWAEPVGFPVEIRPLTRPFGLWAGNLFQGVVLRGGQPVAFATVEVEFRNTGGTVSAPADAFVTQMVTADANGTFSYGIPRPGWWGFAALTEGDRPLPGPDGTPRPVEEGALIWVHAVAMGE